MYHFLFFSNLKLADTLKKSVPSENSEKATKEVEKGIFFVLGSTKNLRMYMYNVLAKNVPFALLGSVLLKKWEYSAKGATSIHLQAT